MAKRTNRVAWGLAVVLAVVLLVSVGVAFMLAPAAVRVENITVTVFPWKYWTVARGDTAAATGGRYVGLGLVQVIIWNPPRSSSQAPPR